MLEFPLITPHSTVYIIFISNNPSPIYSWQKKDFLKYKKVWKGYDQHCSLVSVYICCRLPMNMTFWPFDIKYSTMVRHTLKCCRFKIYNQIQDHSLQDFEGVLDHFGTLGIYLHICEVICKALIANPLFLLSVKETNKRNN